MAHLRYDIPFNGLSDNRVKLFVYIVFNLNLISII